MIPSLRRVRSSDDVVRQLQDAADSVLKVITKKEILDGNFLEDITITAGTPKVVNHLLGEKLRGWISVRKNAQAHVWDSQDTNQTPFSTLILNASASVTISLWVF